MIYLILLFSTINLTEIRVNNSGDTIAYFSPYYELIEGLDSLEKKIFSLTNRERSDNNLSKLKKDKRLKIAGRIHSKDMLEKSYFSHISPDKDGKTPAMRIYNSGIAQLKLSENIARNTGTAVPVLLNNDVDSLARIIMKGWMNSDEHRENILDTEYTHMGIGALYEEETLVVSQEFISDPLDIDEIKGNRRENVYIIKFVFKYPVGRLYVFLDGIQIREEDVEYYKREIKISIPGHSGKYNVDICTRNENIYTCKVRLGVDTDGGLKSIFTSVDW